MHRRRYGVIRRIYRDAAIWRSERFHKPHLLPARQRVLDSDQRTRARRLFEDVDTLSGFEPALLHADLGPEHLLVRDGRLVGVIDWGEARIGDPGLDHAGLLNGPFADWEVDPDLRRRAGFYQRLAPW
jgi:aminoglycoside phosphotransferase (APT) family kinase protein